jgi:ribonuclease VapC
VIVVDTSAVMAFLNDEPEGKAIEEHLDLADDRRMSAVGVLECRTVIVRAYAPAKLVEFERFLAVAAVVIEPFDAEQALVASNAYQKFGKGMGHPAQLNFGDCAVYALAKLRDAPLLFIGNDFRHTDIASVL